MSKAPDKVLEQITDWWNNIKAQNRAQYAENKAAHLKFLRAHIESNRILRRCRLHECMDPFRVSEDYCTLCKGTRRALRACAVEGFTTWALWASYGINNTTTRTRLGLPYTFCNACFEAADSLIQKHTKLMIYTHRHLEMWIPISGIVRIAQDYLFMALPTCPCCSMMQ